MDILTFSVEEPSTGENGSLPYSIEKSEFSHNLLNDENLFEISQRLPQVNQKHCLMDFRRSC